MLPNFRILIMTSKPNPASTGVYTFYSEEGEGQVWSCSSADTAFGKYKDLLATYTTSEMFLVDMVDTNITVNNTDYIDEVLTIPEDAVKIVNDGTNFSITIDTEDNDLVGYTWVNVDDTIAATVKALFESYGLTDVKVTAEDGITASNTTSTPIKGSTIICKGLFRAYNKTKRSDKYVSGVFTVKLS